MSDELQTITTLIHLPFSAAGTTLLTPTDGVDCSGFRSCRFIVKWGAIVVTGVQSVEIHQSSDDGVADAYTAILGTNVAVADTDDEKMTIIDIRHTREIFLKCLVNRSIANSTVDCILAILANARTRPISQSSDVQGYEVHDFAQEGVA